MITVTDNLTDDYEIPQSVYQTYAKILIEKLNPRELEYLIKRLEEN